MSHVRDSLVFREEARRILDLGWKLRYVFHQAKWNWFCFKRKASILCSSLDNAIFFIVTVIVEKIVLRCERSQKCRNCAVILKFVYTLRICNFVITNEISLQLEMNIILQI